MVTLLLHTHNPHMITPGVTMVTVASPANVFANDKGFGGTGEDLGEQPAKLWENIGCLG